MERLFDEMDLDILKEIGNIGAGNAATALSSMVESGVDIGVARCELIPFDHMADLMSGPETIIMGLLVQLTGDVEGFILLAQKLEDAAEAMEMLMGVKPQVSVDDIEKTLEELEPLKEIGNILAGAYISAISSMTGMKIFPCVPEMTVDMAMAIMNIPALIYGGMGEEVLLLETSYMSMERTMSGHFFLMPTVETFGALRKALLGF